MRYLLLVLFFVFAAGNVFGKSKWAKLNERIEALDKALIDKDTITIGNLICPEISYGHSNGWVEHRKEITGDLYNGTLTYKSIETIAKPQISVHAKTGIARLQIRVTVVVEGKELTLKLHVLQVWILEQKEWRLLARQSVKID